MREEVDAVCNSVLQLKESIGNFMEEVQATKRPKTDSGAVPWSLPDVTRCRLRFFLTPSFHNAGR